VGAVVLDPVNDQRSPELFDVVSIEGNIPSKLNGIALDIGSTTMAGYMVDLETGKVLQSHAISNPQIIYGSDVISRLHLCKRKGEEGLIELQNAVIEGANRIINNLCEKTGVARKSVYGITIVGNTVMQHLFMGLNPIGLAEAPYSTVSTTYPAVNASSLGLFDGEDIGHYVSLLNLPGVAGYFGSDAVACALITDNLSTSGKEIGNAVLCIDIGTNGEVVLKTPDGRLLGCSTAAGPAFEGAHIKYGMPAVPGAISRIFFDDHKFTIDLIDPNGEIIQNLDMDAIPEPLYCQGLTGAALLDLISVLTLQGVILPDGKLTQNGELGKRTRKGENGQPEFVIVELEETDKGGGLQGQPIVLTQEDIREVQLAKGAICAGVRTLIHHAEITPTELKRVYLAGSFGSHISPESVRTVGMLPPLPGAKIEPLGNAAGAGSVMALTSRTKLREFYSIASKIEYIELATDSNFQKYFIESMKLGNR
jgi:uncharacterized 2Fe-2S/4Fe-4S cluster protein (DUF4445 family)